MFCTDYQAQVKLEKGELRAEPLYCQCWSCELCRPRRANQLRALARSGQPTSLLTLTVRPDQKTTPDDRAQKLRDAWRKLRQMMRRRWPQADFAFLAVFERTKRGEPHLHILFRGPFVPQQWISERMDRLIGAPICDIRHIDNEGRAAAYVTKYLAKAPEVWEHCKRYWRAQNYELTKVPPPPRTWDKRWLVRRSLTDLCRDQATTGITNTEVYHGGKITFGWWTNSYRTSEPG